MDYTKMTDAEIVAEINRFVSSCLRAANGDPDIACGFADACWNWDWNCDPELMQVVHRKIRRASEGQGLG